MPYADIGYYKDIYQGSAIPDNKVEKKLKKASRHIDILTYNRIVGRGILNLTCFQQEIVRETCCELADFEYDNAELIETTLQNYAINGVSMSFGESWNVKVQNGVVIGRATYETLAQTGLCCRLLR